MRASSVRFDAVSFVRTIRVRSGLFVARAALLALLDSDVPTMQFTIALDARLRRVDADQAFVVSDLDAANVFVKEKSVHAIQ